VGLVDAIDQAVVDDAAVGLADRRVERRVVAEGSHVIGDEVLDGVEGLGAADVDPAHVADVKDPPVAAHGFVLGDDALILDRHLPAGEVDQPAFGGLVTGK